MAKEKIVTIERDGPDQGKVFVLKAMSAYRLEKWSARALLALSRSRADIPPEAAQGGLRALLAVGVHMLSGMSFAEVEPLMDEMLACVSRITNPGKPKLFMRDLQEDDIEQISTLTTLRAELIELHTGFTAPAVLSMLTSGQTAGAPSSTTSTSLAQSGA